MTIDPRLESSSAFICTLNLCQVRLSHNAAFPWLLLIPNKENCTEITDLDPSEQQILIQEINLIAQVSQKLFSPDKLNIATLGNVVPQMHIHIIARYTTDPAWPNPVWNTVTSDYSDQNLTQLIQKIQGALNHILKG